MSENSKYSLQMEQNETLSVLKVLFEEGTKMDWRLDQNMPSWSRTGVNTFEERNHTTVPLNPTDYTYLHTTIVLSLTSRSVRSRKRVTSPYMLERNKYITCYKKRRPSSGRFGRASWQTSGGQTTFFAHLLCQGLNRKCVEGGGSRGRGGVRTA